MNTNELSELTDEELLTEAQKTKLSPLANAFFIGFLIGIVVYSIAVNSWGFFTLLLLYFAYKLVKKSKRDKALEQVLKERNLK